MFSLVADVYTIHVHCLVQALLKSKCGEAHEGKLRALEGTQDA